MTRWASDSVHSFSPIVQIEADARASCAGGERWRAPWPAAAFGPKRRGDAGDVKPRGAGQHGAPVNGIGRQLADRRVRAIVDDGRGALARSGLGEVDPHARAAADDVIGAHALGPQRADGGVADRVRGESRHVDALAAEVREADGHVGFAAAEGRRQRWRLQEPLESRRAEPQHDLAERHDLGFTRVPLAARDVRRRCARRWRAARRSRPRQSPRVEQRRADANGDRARPNPVAGVVERDAAGRHQLHAAAAVLARP